MRLTPCMFTSNVCRSFLTPESTYPYTGKTGTCKNVNSTASRVVLSGTGYTSLATNSGTLFKQVS